MWNMRKGEVLVFCMRNVTARMYKCLLGYHKYCMIQVSV